MGLEEVSAVSNVQDPQIVDLQSYSLVIYTRALSSLESRVILVASLLLLMHTFSVCKLSLVPLTELFTNLVASHKVFLHTVRG